MQRGGNAVEADSACGEAITAAKPTYKRHILRIYLLLAFSIVVLAACFVAFGIQPLKEQLHIQHGLENASFLKQSGLLVQAVVKEHLNLSRQAASRTFIRNALKDYVLGKHSLSNLAALTQPRLGDVLRYNDEIVGITRFEAAGNPAVVLGTSIPPSLYPETTPLPKHMSTQGLIPLKGGRRALLYYSPILDPEVGMLGYDLLLVDDQEIQEVIDTPAYDYGNLFLTKGRDILYAPGESLDGRMRIALESALTGRSIEGGYLISAVPVPRTDWRLHLVVDRSRFFQELDHSVSQLIYIILGATLAVFLLTLFVLRPLIKTLVKERRLYELSTMDWLSGLYTRRHFHGLLDKELSRASRHGHAMSLLMFDVDNFKGINDEYGHQCGDMVIKHIGHIVGDTVRDIDITARYGGDEFVAILPETDAEGAQLIAERLCRNIEQSQAYVNDHKIGVTVSIGVATYDASRGEQSGAGIMAMADQALYLAKHEGRNRVSVAQPHGHAGVSPAANR